ncbi:hypothetical protein V8G54_025269 [Vigna mungo]|uniref:Uncharacterized protein n=1 Tax=Vigna mungo TaxID=3915 RepID=A0AAQ3N7E3_VIGMU
MELCSINHDFQASGCYSYFKRRTTTPRYYSDFKKSEKYRRQPYITKDPSCGLFSYFCQPADNQIKCRPDTAAGHFVTKIQRCDSGTNSTTTMAKVYYLDHLISAQGVQLDPKKIVAAQQWPRPTNLKELRGFLDGGTSNISATEDTPYVWSGEAYAAFNTLKKALTSATVLILPDFFQAFTIETEASGIGTGGHSGYELTYRRIRDHFYWKGMQKRSQKINTREETSHILQTNLVKAQARMKWYAHFKRMTKQYQVGDLAYLKIQPSKKNSSSNTNLDKLAAKFYGPYSVLEMNGNVAFKLDLPPKAKIHNVIHVRIKENNKQEQKWKETNPEDAVWRELHKTQLQFPDFQWLQSYMAMRSSPGSMDGTFRVVSEYLRGGKSPEDRDERRTTVNPNILLLIDSKNGLNKLPQ